MSKTPGAWKYYVAGVSEYPKGHKCSQQSSSLKGDGYIPTWMEISFYTRPRLILPDLARLAPQGWSTNQHLRIDVCR